MANLSNINNKFLVTTGGNVLIGQTSAVGSSIFQVTGNATFAGSVGIGIAPDSNLRIANNDSSSYRFGYAGTSDVYLDADYVYFRSDNGGVNNITFNGGNATFAGNITFGATNPFVQSTNVLSGTGTDGARIRSAVSSATNPTFSNSDDTNTGMFFATADTLGFSTGGSERMRIDSSGNVGIGTDSPTSYSGYSTLALNGTNGGLLEFKKGDVQQAYIANAGSPLLQFVTNGSERMRIDSSGNVRIGTGGLANTHSKLDVIGGPYAFLALQATDTGGRRWELFSYATTESFHIYDRTNDQYRFTIDETGKVGIGTTSPNAKLDVDGTIRISTSGRVEGRSYPYTTNLGSGADATTTYLIAGSTAPSVTSIDLAGGSAANPKTIIFKTASTERMRIASNGAIGIGGTNYGSSGEVLTSNGNAAPSWQAAGGSAWPQEKMAVYTINSTTSNILIATMNSTTWHGDYYGGCLKFTINDTNYIQVSYVTIYTYLSGTNKWFFKGNTEMTTHNNGTNPIRYVFAFSGAYGSHGPTCTLKINRSSNGGLGPVNVLVQAISSPDMFILN